MTALLIQNPPHRKKNAFVKFNDKQEGSIIFKEGTIINGYLDRPRKRKFIDDILVIGSLLTGWNWELYSRRSSRSFPLLARPNLESLDLYGKAIIERNFQIVVKTIKEPSWQTQFENGFHLRMLLNHANITNIESRFLSNIVIWEWLYPHLKNPNGASSYDESNDLKQILNFIFKKYWPNMSFDGNNIFYVLRNQLAHSGKLPIDRKYADSWMTALKWEFDNGINGIKNYIDFFDKLTQVIVLKTLNIDADHLIQNQLNNFLIFGKI